MNKIRSTAMLSMLVAGICLAVPPPIAPLQQGEPGHVTQSKINTAFQYIYQNASDIDSGGGGGGVDTGTLRFDANRYKIVSQVAIAQQDTAVVLYEPNSRYNDVLVYLDFNDMQYMGLNQSVRYPRDAISYMAGGGASVFSDGLLAGTVSMPLANLPDDVASSDYYVSYMTHVPSSDFGLVEVGLTAPTPDGGVREIINIAIISDDGSRLRVSSGSETILSNIITPGNHSIVCSYVNNESLLHAYVDGTLIGSIPLLEISTDYPGQPSALYVSGADTIMCSVDDVVLALGTPPWGVTAAQTTPYSEYVSAPSLELVPEAGFAKTASRKYPIFAPFSMLMGVDALQGYEVRGITGSDAILNGVYIDDGLGMYRKIVDAGEPTETTCVMYVDHLDSPTPIRWTLLEVGGTTSHVSEGVSSGPPAVGWRNPVNSLLLDSISPGTIIITPWAGIKERYAVDIELKCSRVNYKYNQDIPEVSYWYDSRDLVHWSSYSIAAVDTLLYYTASSKLASARSHFNKPNFGTSLAGDAGGQTVRSVIIAPGLSTTAGSIESWLNPENTENLTWSYSLFTPLSFEVDETGTQLWRPCQIIGWSNEQYHPSDP